ncbi:MAG: TolC family protein [Candidatus Omnitrophica bacterium]|nr:TolC family protein [Candidatus Omnitrophota bacterium]
MFTKAVVVFIAGVLCAAQGVAYPADALSLDVLIAEARQNNPDILAARKRWEASVARVPLSKSLEDPSIGIAFEKIPRGTLKLNKTMPDERMLSFSQFLPFFGKLSLKGKIAVVESQIFASAYKAKELDVVNQVKNAYYSLFLTHKEEGLFRESLALLEGIVKVAEKNYTVGDISQEEVYKIHLEAARLNIAIKNLEQERSSRQASLNALLNRDPEDPLGTPQLREDISFSADIKSLYQSAVMNQPELLAFSYAIERNKHAKALAKRSFFPDLMAGIVQRGITSGTLGPWDLLLSFNVPLWFWTKQKYEVREAIASLEEAEAAYKAMQNRTFAEVKDLTVKAEVAKNKIRLYKADLIPLLESSIAVSMAAFRSGEGDFMMLLDNQRMLVATELDYYRALVEYNMNLADLERQTGVKVSEVRNEK